MGAVLPSCDGCEELVEARHRSLQGTGWCNRVQHGLQPVYGKVWLLQSVQDCSLPTQRQVSLIHDQNVIMVDWQTRIDISRTFLMSSR